MAISAHSFQFKSIRFDLKTNFLSHMIFLFFSFFHSNCKVYFYRICAFYRNIVHFCLLFLSLYSVAIYLPIFNFCKERKKRRRNKKKPLLLLKLVSMQNISITRMPIFLAFLSVYFIFLSIFIIYIFCTVLPSFRFVDF